MNKHFDTKKMVEVVLAFNSVSSYEELLEIILTKMMEITNSDAGTLYTVDHDKLYFRIMKNETLGVPEDAALDLPPIDLSLSSIENISAYAAINNEIVIVDDVYESRQFNFSGPKNYDKLTGYRTQSMLVLPLANHENEATEVLGVIQLINAKDYNSGAVIPFGDIYSPPVIPSLANIAASTLSNLIRIKEIRTLFHSFVSAMVGAIDARSRYNSKHTENVTKLCDGFAKFLRKNFSEGHPYHFTEKRIEELNMAAMLHDIGKIATPRRIMDKSDRLDSRIEGIRYRFEIAHLQAEIDIQNNYISKYEYEYKKQALTKGLRKIEKTNRAGYITDQEVQEIQTLTNLEYRTPDGETIPILDHLDMEALSIQKGTLTPEERHIMQEHAIVTGRILDNIDFNKYYENVPIWAKSHHEFLDGTGYPYGLKSDELSIEIFIITIADIFEALTSSDRPYKKAMNLDKTFNILEGMAKDGKLHFELVELFKESEVWLDM